MADPPGTTLREVHLKVDLRFALVKIVAKADETGDTNLPKNLHNAAELLLRANMIDAAERLRGTTIAMLDIYAAGPDGKTALQLGRACVCWACGHAGLPRPGPDGKRRGDDDLSAPPGPCGHCDEGETVNWLRVTQKGDAKEAPWIAAAELSVDAAAANERAAKAARRAEVVANVAAAHLAQAATPPAASSHSS
ncbi:hypothetical protein T492DRAFT_940482 [Pavlovales sp. CCMP2436]|nr:hypothetical protein T492DRAFT_940482 [Pavlovales sp. CCMP2436]|mmetsp:Transcript_44094/g.109186  ORF Transcript_44094/g.109186 Transcript_44094/m.109186 type:complete len:194 (+) Transcript_44094:74-655(+)